MPYTVPKLDDYSPEALDRAIAGLRSALEQEVAGVKSEADHEALRIRWRARTNGILTQINDSWLKAAPKEAKRDVGQRVNELKTWVEERVESAKPGAASASVTDKLDITLPGIRRPLGAEHPVVKTTNEIIGIFAKMGYSVETGPEIETDYYNFESLNFPPNHPARDTQDTIFI